MHLLAFLGIGGVGSFELIMIAVVAVLLFGSKLPEVARSVGQSYTQFRRGLNDIQSSIKNEIDRELDEVKRLPSEVERSIGQLDSPEEEPYNDNFEPPED